LWADLDRDRRVGGSIPNQNAYVFVIAPEVLYEDDGSPISSQTVKVEVKTGAIVKKNPEFL